MSFKAEKLKEKIIGFSYETNDAYFFFGTKNLLREELPLVFPKYKFAFLKQVHGKSVLKADPSIIREADAHFTSQKNLALVSQSADCIPILLANEFTVCAIHSGWRGTALNIVATAGAAFPNSPPSIAAIGPHILKNSFEVGLDVAQQLLASTSDRAGLLIPHPDPMKTYFDLTEMVRRQLRGNFGDLQIAENLHNTQTDFLYHSYRRGKQLADRQYSFVVLKD